MIELNFQGIEQEPDWGARRELRLDAARRRRCPLIAGDWNRRVRPE